MQKITQNTMKRPWEPPQSTQKITPDPALKVPEVWRFFRIFENFQKKIYPFTFTFFVSRKLLELYQKSQERPESEILEAFKALSRE